MEKPGGRAQAPRPGVKFGRLRKSLPGNTVNLFHDLANFIHHMLAGLTFRCELHETDLVLFLTEIHFPHILLVFADADSAAMRSALEII